MPTCPRCVQDWGAVLLADLARRAVTFVLMPDVVRGDFLTVAGNVNAR